ncbi:MAG: ABC transporter permease [Planctomycetales bacterium]|nr:ABC transporter permease [Planctomycetales bacterium]
MYKLLLAWRYLRSRYIALASIVSVTLGVATLVVVNSVMSGFTTEMHKRLHGILSDIEFSGSGLGEIHDVDGHLADIKQILGDDLECASAIVRVPALVHQQFHGRMITQQLMLIGIDAETYGKVSDFSPYLLAEQHRNQPAFDLLESGYDERLGDEAGWDYRRRYTQFQREQRRLMNEAYGISGDSGVVENLDESAFVESDDESSQPAASGVVFTPLPAQPPVIVSDGETSIDSPPRVVTSPPSGNDPFAAARSREQGHIFDPMVEQHPGIILGVALSSRKFHDPETNEVREVFIDRPGDDVQITLPSSGTPPRPTAGIFTVVDYYESQMHEYDSTLAFVELKELQRLRRMIAPDGSASVTSIQIKLRPGADLDEAHRKLVAAFPPDVYPYQIQSWRDVQGPLLAAVQMEITILNILLFMIIAVAGFGILATFFMIVVEKTRDIGIMKALGAPNGGVMSIFLGYGLSLGIVGAGVGIVMGLLFVGYINEIADVVELITGQEVFDPTIYYFNKIPTIVNPWTVCWIALGAMAIAVLASVLPARHAAKLHPVEALRYE